MGVKIDPLKCTACMACEMACGYHRDDALALLSACIVAYRTKEKKNYFGVVVKESDNLVIARPEGLEVKKIGVVEEKKEADASAKPMLLREPCNLCTDREGGPLCREFCPADAIYLD
jgi:Fe-S-cluster-containing dehydrogenase component